MKVLISGTFSEQETSTLSKMAEFFGFEPVIIPWNTKFCSAEVVGQRINALVNDVDYVFSYTPANEVRPICFAVEEQLAEQLKKPFYNRDAIERNIIRSIIGLEAKWDEPYHWNDDGDTDDSESTDSSADAGDNNSEDNDE